MDILTKEILELFISGRTASSIDNQLKLPTGTAHDTVVAWWRGVFDNDGYPSCRPAAFDGATNY